MPALGRRAKQRLDEAGQPTAWFAGEQRASERLTRMGDIVAASALLIITGPLIAFAAIAIKCETEGPVFGASKNGLSQARRSTLRLRTRVNDPERGRASELTHVGRFLDYTRIDALPQLINVLRGEVSLFDPGRRPSFFD